MINLMQNPRLSEDLTFCSAAIRDALELAWKRTAVSADERFANAKPSINVLFTDETGIREINAEQRDVSAVTDVLSFPMFDFLEGRLTSDFNPVDIFEDEDEGPMFEVGDIVICVPRAFDQAKEFGHSRLREMVFLALHGMLHLCGYDHIDERMARRMETEQNEVLDALGLDRDVKTYDGVPAAIEILEELEEPGGSDSDPSMEDPAVRMPNTGGADGVDLQGDDDPFYSGFVSLVGRPNAGKSTLLNYLTGLKLAIVSPKSQTTRSAVRSIVNKPNAQLIFIDTPGMHRPTNKLGRSMMQDTWRSFDDADIVLLLVDGIKGNFTSMEQSVIKKASESNQPIVLAINKTDDMVKENLLPIISTYNERHPFEAIVPISARTGDGVEVLMDELIRLLPEGPRYYPKDTFTDQSERSLAAELIREQILRYTHDEIPHGTAVLIDKFEETFATPSDDSEHSEYDREIVRIYATIFADRGGHKGILIGKEGAALKRIGTAARRSLEAMLGCKVYLELFVKVRKDWRNSGNILSELGFKPTKN